MEITSTEFNVYALAQVKVTQYIHPIFRMGSNQPCECNNTNYSLIKESSTKLGKLVSVIKCLSSCFLLLYPYRRQCLLWLCYMYVLKVC